MKDIRAVIFDMDGVLIDAKEWHYEAFNMALQKFGYEISRREHLELYDGLPTRRKLELLTERDGLPLDLHSEIYRLKQEHTREISSQRCKISPTHHQSLQWLRDQRYSLCVASNSIRDTVSELLAKAGLDKFLEFSLSNEDVPNPKPSPDIYKKAIDRLGMVPHQCLVVEDHPYGVQAARMAGAHVMKVETVNDVNCDNLANSIRDAEKANEQKDLQFSSRDSMARSRLRRAA